MTCPCHLSCQGAQSSAFSWGMWGAQTESACPGPSPAPAPALGPRELASRLLRNQWSQRVEGPKLLKVTLCRDCEKQWLAQDTAGPWTSAHPQGQIPSKTRHSGAFERTRLQGRAQGGSYLVAFMSSVSPQGPRAGCPRAAPLWAHAGEQGHSKMARKPETAPCCHLGAAEGPDEQA